MEKGYFDPYNNLAFAYGALGRIDQAIWALKQGLQIYSYQPKVYNNLATYLIMKNEYDIAVKAAGQAIELYPYYGKAYFNKGRAHLALDQNEEAWNCFKTCCTAADFDNETQGYELYGSLSLKLGKYDDAIFAFSKLFEIEKSPSILFQLGNAHYHKKDYPQAIKCYRQSLATAPNNTNIMHNLCECYLEDNQPHMAINMIKEMEKSGTRYPDTGLQKAWAYSQLGDKNMAIQTLNRFINTSPSGDYLTQAMQMLHKLQTS